MSTQTISQPTGCIDEKPTRFSVYFCGRFISISQISRSQGISKAYISRIFSGEKLNPSYVIMKKISSALGMDMEEFSHALSLRYIELGIKDSDERIEYLSRVIAEDKVSLERLRKGKPALPVRSGTRLDNV
jgi:transcriptional regulator with XRE-family HTH domain